MAFTHNDLTMADRNLARARNRLERQRELLQRLAAGRQDTSRAEAMFKVMRRTLESFEAERRTIEDEMFAFRGNRG